MLVVDGVEMMDVREAARLVGRSPETVRRWIWSGRLSAMRQGNRLLMARAAVEELASGPAVEEPPTLRQWAAQAQKQRRSGALGEEREGTSAADVLLEDRAAGRVT